MVLQLHVSVVAGALLSLAISCGASSATEASHDEIPDGSTMNPGQPDAAAGAPGLTLCSTAIGSCRFDSAAACPTSQPAAGAACAENAALCYYCPVSGFSINVSACRDGHWSNTRASCGN